MHVSVYTYISTYFSITTLIFINKRSRRRELERSQLNISNLGFLASVPFFSSSCSSRAAARSLHFNLMEHQSKSEQEETNTLASPRSKDEPVTSSSSSSKGSAKKPVRIVIKPPSANNEQIKQSVKIEEEDSDSTDDYFLSAEELVEDPVSSESTESDGNGKLYADNVGDIESPYKRICNLCGKSFQSDEALYGSTRLHSHKSSVKKQVKDEALPPSSISYQNLKWKITGKRGRGKKDASDSQSEDVTEVGNTHEDSTIMKSEQDEDKLQTGIELTIQLKNVSDSEVKSLLGHIDEVVGITSANAKVSTMIGSSNATISNEEPKAKRIKLEHSKNDGNSGHVCHICGKAFATHQALGGHAASHNKGKYKLDEGGDQTSKKSKKNTGDSEHRCNKCGAVFQTGQSLGGHMRAHYDPGKDKKSDDKDIVESSTANTMQETGQLPIVKEDNGKVINESTSTNTTMEETGASPPIVNEDIGTVPSESEQNSLQPASAAAPAFDLNEMPGY